MEARAKAGVEKAETEDGAGVSEGPHGVVVAPELGAQSAGPQCDGGFAVNNGLMILPDMR